MSTGGAEREDERGATLRSETSSLPLVTRVIAVGVACAGLACFAIAVSTAGAFQDMTTQLWGVATVVGGLALYSWLRPLVLYRGDRSEAFHLDEGFFVILALLVGPGATMVVFAAAVILSQVIKQRPLLKAAFNFGQVMIAVGVGLYVSRSLAEPSTPLSPGAIGAAALGAAAYFVTSTGAVSAILVSMGARWRDCTSNLSIQVALTAVGVLVGTVLALTVQSKVWALLLAVPLMVVLRLILAQQFKATHDRARMAGLFNVTLDANRALAQESVVDTVLASARQLMRCTDAHLAKAPPGPEGMAAPIDVGGSRQWLVVSGRQGEEPFDSADRILLDALAAIGRGALTNAELYSQIRYERGRLASITLNIGEGVCAVDALGKLTFVNPAASSLLDLPTVGPADELLDEHELAAPNFLMVPAYRAMRTGRPERDDDARFEGEDGRSIPVAYTASAVMHNGEAVGAVITFRDITERKAFEDTMTHHAFYDSLTGLANRRMLVERLEQAVQQSEMDHKVHALIFIDVDRFKSINDSLGHGTGDDLLVAIGDRIRQAIHSRDLLARFGGDEFVVLVRDVSDVEEAVGTARRILACVEEPLVLPDGYEIVASVSLGVALTKPGQSADDILRDADVAMYKAKGRGGTYQVFDKAQMGSRSSERIDMETDLRKGIERDELEVHFQPLISIDELTIVGAEALVRWRHPRHGLVAPDRFIPLAEETGLILPIGRYVLEQACVQIRAIRDRLGLDVPISVNLSPRQFQQTSLLGDVATVLDEAGLPSDLLTFEITETMVMDDLAGAREVMKKLNRLGVRLAIDDFGTGHSSLGYLKQFPVHEVKVDRLFVNGVATDPVDTAIVRAVVDLANAMQIAAVAEGVETLDQLAGLRMLGCHVAQGYYFAKPLPPAQFHGMVDSHFESLLEPPNQAPQLNVV